MHSQLAAILVLDVAGYSRQMNVDELGTHEAVMQLRKRVIEPRIAEHQGEVIKFTGDGVMACFSSAIDATRCAIDVQRDAIDTTLIGEDGHKLVLRIGIHLGEVIVEEDKEIYGDDVNIAVRLEEIAEPGQIYVSKPVHDQVVKKTSIKFARVGSERVKNISDPIEVYTIPVGDPVSPPGAGSKTNRNIYIGLVAVVVLFVAANLFYYFKNQSTQLERFDTSDALKPTFAVLPFRDLSANESSTQFADGITEDIIADLAKVSAIDVISRNSSAMIKSAGTFPQNMYEELGARYVLAGEVEKQNDSDRLLINTELTDTVSGKSLWAESYDIAVNGIFELQNSMVGSIVDVLSIGVSADEKSRIDEKDTTSISAYSGYNKAWKHVQKNTPQDLAIALLELSKVIEIDPNYAKAYAAIGHIYFNSWLWGWESYVNTDFRSAPGLAKRYLKKSLELKPSAVAHQLSANIALYDRNFDEAMTHARTANSLEPSDIYGLLTMAELLIYMGMPQDALPYVEKVAQLDPLNPAYVSFLMGLIHFGEEEYLEATQLFETALEQNPDDFAPAAPLTSAYAKLDDETNMNRALERYREGWPRANIKVFQIFWPYQHQVDEDRLLNGLRKAGMPES